MSTAPESPRTAEKPMAFDVGDFISGAARAILLHLVLFSAILTSIGIVSSVPSLVEQPGQTIPLLLSFLGVPIVVIFSAVPYSLVGALIGALPAYLLGRAMVRVRSFRIHLLAWCAFGVIFSGAVSAAIALVQHLDYFILMSTLFGAAFLASAVAIPLAWARTASIALREDRGLKPLPWFRCGRRTPTAIR